MRELLEEGRNRLEQLFHEDGSMKVPLLLGGIILPVLVVGLALAALGEVNTRATISSPPLRQTQRAAEPKARPSTEAAPTLLRVQELEQAITRVKEHGWTINDQLGRLREELSGGKGALAGMRSLVEEMSRDAAAAAGQPIPPSNLEVKRGALQLSYSGWQATKTEYQTAVSELAISLALVDELVANVRTASRNLEEALARDPSTTPAYPVPGDEEVPITSLQAVAQAAAQELASGESSWAESIRIAEELLAQGQALVETARNAAQASRPPQFQLGFKALAEKIPTVVGEPLENEHPDPATGDTIQRTTRGLLVWRRSDNWTAFTDGSRTWINGPLGIQMRDNDQTFNWERTIGSNSSGPSTQNDPS